MYGEPEQVHFGSVSTIFKIPTNRGAVFFKTGFKGNGEPQKTKAVIDIFPDDTPKLLGVDLKLEAMLSEDHGQSVHNLYIVREDEKPELEASEEKSLFSAALTQWARIQKDSIGRIHELRENGIPLYDKSWTRAGFSELVSYLQEVKLDSEYEIVIGFEKRMEQTFDVWERFNIPNALVHGDLHTVNVAQPGGLGTKFIFFDWDSSFIGDPFFDFGYNDTDEIFLGKTRIWSLGKTTETLNRLRDSLHGQGRYDI